MKGSSVEVIQHNKLAKFHNGIDIFFIKTDYLLRFFEDIKNYTTPITLITGNSDYPITDEVVDLAPSCVTRWFGQGINTDAPFVSAVPFGIENSETCVLGEAFGYGWPHAVEKVAVLEDPPSKQPTKEIYANFSESTYPGRPSVAKLCREISYITDDIRSVCNHRTYDQFVDTILDHKMVVCPRGNAFAETHRFWEVLYLNRIPIVKYKKGIAPFIKLPVIVLDDWDKLTDLEFLHSEYEKVKDNSKEMLDMSYWVNLVTGE